MSGMATIILIIIIIIVVVVVGLVAGRASSLQKTEWSKVQTCIWSS